MASARLQIVSDLHLEAYKDGGRAVLESRIPWDGQADAVVLAGDIASCGWTTGTLELTLRHLSGIYPQVFFVPGNHEFYGGEIDARVVARTLRELAADTPGVTLLEPGVVGDVRGTRVIGATLWFEETRAARVCEPRLMDFRAIRSFKPWVYEQHQAHVAWLKREVRAGDIVVSHHLPSPLSVSPRYRDDPTNCYFLHNLSSLILERRPALWVHGHTHAPCDYTLYATRVVANPYGYPHEARTGYRPLDAELPQSGSSGADASGDREGAAHG